MKDIELIEPVVFQPADGEAVTITAIKVAPIGFAEFVKLWEQAPIDPKKPEVGLQKRRILHQAHFMVGKDRFVPTVQQLGTVDFRTVKQILDTLQLDQGTAGQVISKDADGLSKPILYKLGDPIKMKSGKGADASISEIEFMGKTYAQLEDVLAADNELAQTVALLRAVGKAVNSPLPLLTDTIIEKISMADGVTIMREVLPRF